MNKNLILSGIAVAAFLVSGCGKKETQSSATFESEEMAEDMNSALSNETTSQEAAQDEGVEQNQIMPAAMAVAYDPSQPYVKPTDQEVQQSLKNAGVYSGKVDGVVGPRTKKAIRDFQAQNSLTADGRVGPQTWARLAPYLHSSQDATVAPASAPAASGAEND